MLHYMKLQPGPFNLIKSGKKTIELRLLDAKRQALNVNDQIEFSNLQDQTEKIRTRVVALHKFSSFKELYKNLPLEKCGYEMTELKTAHYSDMEEYYPVEKQKQYGVLGIEIALLPGCAQDLIRTSRYISMLLRHKPQAAGLTLDESGWANVQQLIAGVSKTHPLDMKTLEEIVETDDKQRYSFNGDKTLIRANQGHSVPVDVHLAERIPPAYLWHGTGEKYTESIEKEGLKSKTRLYVHLSQDFDTAVSVGFRHGKPVVYRVDTEKMHKAGFKFYQSANNVWLTKYVPAEFLQKKQRSVSKI